MSTFLFLCCFLILVPVFWAVNVCSSFSYTWFAHIACDNMPAFFSVATINRQTISEGSGVGARVIKFGLQSTVQEFEFCAVCNWLFIFFCIFILFTENSLICLLNSLIIWSIGRRHLAASYDAMFSLAAGKDCPVTVKSRWQLHLGEFRFRRFLACLYFSDQK